MVFGLSYDVLVKKPKAFLIDQLDKRELPMTKTDRKSISIDDLASLIKAIDTDSTAHLSDKLKRKRKKTVSVIIKQTKNKSRIVI